MRFKPGDLVKHDLFDLGHCIVIGYSKTQIGWLVAIIKDRHGELHRVNDRYLKIAK